MIHANEHDTGQRSALDYATPLCIISGRNVTVSSTNLEEITEDICVMKQNIEKLVESNCNERITKPSLNIKNVETNEELEMLVAKVTLARSLRDIESAGFKSDEEKELFCSVCTTEGIHANKTNNSSTTGIFKYKSVTGVSFGPDQCLPEKFRNLKHVKRHINQSISHVQHLQSQIKTKIYEAGMNLGQTCYKLYLKSRPFNDYEEDILILKQSKDNVGQLNHLRKFAATFLPHVGKEVQSRMKKFLTSKLVTGHHLHSLPTKQLIYIGQDSSLEV